VPSEPAAAPQERVAPEGTTRASSPEIQDAEECTGAALLQGVAGSEAQTLEPAPRGRPLSSTATTLRMTRRLRRATPWSAGWIGRAVRSTS
jgi:hypothetical protein